MQRLAFRKNTGLRRVTTLGVALLVAVLAGQWSIAPAMGAYDSSTETSHSATVQEAYELSGLIASPKYANWYWTHSDVWEPTDVYAACANLAGSALAECQQVQRTRLWALRLDPVTHAVLEARAFTVSNRAWATNPFIAQNNDWEDISLSPRGNLLIAATGNADGNRVFDASGRDITCDTRRLIELPEPNLTDAAATTWTPWKIFDLKNIIGTAKLKSCNVETLVVGPGEQTAYIVTKTLRKLFARSLDVATGRDPGTPRAATGSGLAYEPSATYLGNVRDALGLRIMAADANNAYVSLLVPRTATKPCQILTWPIQTDGLGTTLTAHSPTKHLVTCTGQTEGLAYNRTPSSGSTNDLVAVADANSSSRSKFLYWYLPDS